MVILFGAAAAAVLGRRKLMRKREAA